MPVLKDFRQTKTITLPSYPDSKVEIYDSLLVGDLPSIDPNEKNLVKTSLEALPKFIKSWNFTDEAEQALPVTRENMNFLKEVDARFIFEAITEFNDEIKKKQNISQP